PPGGRATRRAGRPPGSDRLRGAAQSAQRSGTAGRRRTPAARGNRLRAALRSRRRAAGHGRVVARPGGAGMIRKLALMTTFWGQRFTDFFDRYCIPSLLTADNLPRLAGSGVQVTILLYTEPATFETLKQSPRFERLSRVAEIRPVFFDSFRTAGMP